MTGLANSRTLTVSIEMEPKQVYEYVRNISHFPEWATSFCLSVRPLEDHWWEVRTTDGSMNMRFVDDNDFGVLDHFVVAGEGQPILNAMRVIANGSGCEVLFTAFRQPGMSDEKFAQDASMIANDLNTLKRVLENRSAKDHM